jgi:hypothetical protein
MKIRYLVQVNIIINLLCQKLKQILEKQQDNGYNSIKVYLAQEYTIQIKYKQKVKVI